MPGYKSEAIEHLIKKGALTITPGSPRTTASDRSTEHYFNSGLLDDGESAVRIGNAYAQAVLEHIGAENFDTVFGPPYKGISLSVMVAEGLMRLGVNKKFAFYRKEEKVHGEGSGKAETKAQRQKRIIVGAIKNGERLVIVDDAISTGGTKAKVFDLLDAVADGVEVAGGIILLDRQELNEKGEPPIEAIARENRIRFHSVLTISDVLDYLEERPSPETSSQRKAILDYLSAWGIPGVRRQYGLYQSPLLEGRTLVPSLDVDLDRAIEVVRQTKGNPKVSSYKVSVTSGFEGWVTWVQALKSEIGNSGKKLIMDGQKFGNDVPHTGRKLVQKLKKAGFDAVILCPFTGPNTQVAWTGEAIQAGLTVIVGAEMTHTGFLRSEGGSIPEEALPDIYLRAARQGITHYVFPGNKPEKITAYINLIRGEGVEPIGFSPGFVNQGGKTSDAIKAAQGISYHPIPGRAIYEQKDMAAAAMELARGL